MRKSVHARQNQALTVLLRGLRQQAGLTQQALAERLDKPQSFVAKYEAGERRLDLPEVLRIAAALGADPVGIVKAVIAAARLK